MVSQAPPEFLGLAADPIRWQILGELARSDRRVNELTTAIGVPQNLISYHLGQLRRAELVSSRRSSADGRDTYYRAELSHLRSRLVKTAAVIHPGLCVGAAEPEPDAVSPARVLFLCTGNSARSQMAQALTVLRSGGRVQAASAGSHPKPLQPDAVRVLRERYGLDISAAQPTHLDRYMAERFDRVVTLCDRVREVCPEFPGHPDAVHWSMADPAAAGRDDAFVATAAELDDRIGFLLADLAAADLNHPEEHP